MDEGLLDDYLDGLFDDDLCDITSKDDKKDETMQQVVAICNGRVCVTRNHSKVMVGYGDDYAFAIASSANVNTNPRIENTTITVDKEVADFYKTFFDDLIPFNGNPKGWEPYHA